MPKHCSLTIGVGHEFVFNNHLHYIREYTQKKKWFQWKSQPYVLSSFVPRPNHSPSYSVGCLLNSATSFFQSSKDKGNTIPVIFQLKIDPRYFQLFFTLNMLPQVMIKKGKHHKCFCKLYCGVPAMSE